MSPSFDDLESSLTMTDRYIIMPTADECLALSVRVTNECERVWLGQTRPGAAQTSSGVTVLVTCYFGSVWVNLPVG